MTQTNASLADVLINVLDRAIAGRPISVNGPFTDALRAQERIGWRALLQGYWAQEWQLAFLTTYTPPTVETPKDKAKRHIQMDRWQTRIIRTIWTSMIALWKIRNDDRHGRDAETKETSRHEVLTNELRLFYTNRDQYPIEVQNLLYPTFEEHYQDKSYKIENWLNAYRVTFEIMQIRPED
jgi:hypothetical protein